MGDQVGKVEFNCSCGLKVKSRQDQGGKIFKCPGCGKDLKVPKVIISSAGSTSLTNLHRH